MNLTLSLIAAVSHDNVIGINHNIPWRLRRDLEHFKRVTSEIGILIMGRKTYESLPFFLKDRTHIVITSQSTLPQKKNCDPSLIYLVPSFEAALEYAAQRGTEAVVIGGSMPYACALDSPLLKTMYLTLVKTSIIEPRREYDHIAYLQTPDFDVWGTPVDLEEVAADTENQFPYTMMKFQR
jgi:dihydrofolate reductase